ncbi:hypothetical protein BCV72DRAFT_13010 [Rhizopus microsporus var. microsporus]|uniref:Uncharacterized protein n=1 Tax=Rhizopus microsporus var. microsporus TaxID=86635 RepID=A0A1X0QXT7_RHIZD|nr:hypothetical protein BCV72DRAFT_13010 [Rhizopus microsporus var. microsporus]
MVKKSKEAPEFKFRNFTSLEVWSLNSRSIQGQLAWFFLSISSPPSYNSTHCFVKSVPIQQVRIVSAGHC